MDFLSFSLRTSHSKVSRSQAKHSPAAVIFPAQTGLTLFPIGRDSIPTNKNRLHTEACFISAVTLFALCRDNNLIMLHELHVTSDGVAGENEQHARKIGKVPNHLCQRWVAVVTEECFEQFAEDRCFSHDGIHVPDVFDDGGDPDRFLNSWMPPTAKRMNRQSVT